jgi:hypothetical protein
MKKMILVVFLVFGLLVMHNSLLPKATAQTACTFCDESTGCRTCGVRLAGWVNCMAVCDYCEATTFCPNGSNETTSTNSTPATKGHGEARLVFVKQPATALLRDEGLIPALNSTSALKWQENCPSVVNVHFDKNHILELAKKDLTLAFVIARTQISKKAVGEVITLSWTTVDISERDLQSLLANDAAWLNQYMERAKKTLSISRSNTAVFHILISDLGNNRLKYTIKKVDGPQKMNGLDQVSFEMTFDPQSKMYQSSKCLL